MTPAKLQELARQAGALLPHESACGTALTRFAALVRVAVLEEAAQTCEKIGDEYEASEGGRWPELKSDAKTGARDCETAVRALAQQAGGEQGGQGTIPADRRHDADEKG